VTHIQWSGREEITGASVLVAMFAETQSPSVRLLGEQDMNRQDAVNFIAHGTLKAS
jgi:ATP-dependent Clp protease ATP-binding subunit ClpA